MAQIVKEIASGVNDSRPQLLALLKDQQATQIVVEHKDRLTRFGFRYLETLLELQGRTIEVVNLAENDKEDLIADLAAIVYSFTAQIIGQRRAKRKTERIVLEAAESCEDWKTVLARARVRCEVGKAVAGSFAAEECQRQIQFRQGGGI